MSEEEDEESFKPVETVIAHHHELILSATQRCIAKHSGRSMMFLPPGSAKSTYGTVVGPTWAMGQKPGFKVIGVSYGSDLARKFGRRMRSIVKQRAYHALFDTTLSSESSAADEWALDNGSEYMGGGILSGITGNRADFIPIDDPIKGRQEADSEVTRKRTIEAYEDDILTRLKPGGSVMITQTRWHEEDLAGALLPAAYDGRSGEIECRDGNIWEVTCIPAQAYRADDPLGRKIGEYIWPEWFPEDHWKPFKRKARTWSALYQQKPTPDEGNFWKSDWFKPYVKVPERSTLRVYGASDYAVTADGGDYTVHGVFGVDPEGRPYLLDLWREQTSSLDWVESFCDLVLKWKPLEWAEEQGQIKSGVGPFLDRRQRERRAYVVRSAFPTRGGDKAIRAQAARGYIEEHGLYVPTAADWYPDFRSELMSFPAGRHDDQHDVVGLFGQLLDRVLNGTKPKAAVKQVRDAWDNNDEGSSSWKVA